ncbi:MAG TPA: VOC family protein [Candidatus Binataceae bacterium]|nr:VOC family protein [Candidatus Binataceae bacterium]
MDLARPQIDVGLFTHNKLQPMQAFYGDKLGLKFESVMPVGGGFRQHRYLCNGSVIKLMDSREPLRPRRPGGYETLMLAMPATTQAEALADPDDNTIEVVPPGRDDVNQIEIRVGVSDVGEFGEFYTSAFGAVSIGHDRYRIGETIFGVYHEPEIHRPKLAPFANPLEVVQAMAELGIQYVTVQVRNCDAAFEALKAAGAAVAVPPANFGTVARICFVRDPDGNFIEIAQRPPA